MVTGSADLTDVTLRLAGAFYTFAGYVALRAALTSYFIDRAIDAIAAQKSAPAEVARSAWLICAAIVVLAAGVMLMLLLDASALVFLAAALGQALYLFVVAPRYFDVGDPPDAKGRRQSTNAFVVYCAATAFVIWASLTGRLLSFEQVPWPLLAGAAATVLSYIGYVGWLLVKPMKSSHLPIPGGADDLSDDPGLSPSTSKRVKLMADFDAHPLWALDDGLYGDFAPQELNLSPALTEDLNAWAEAYASSRNRDDPATSLWSEERHRSHAAEARPLAIRLARERPDLTVFIPEGEGLVEVGAGERS